MTLDPRQKIVYGLSLLRSGARTAIVRMYKDDRLGREGKKRSYGISQTYCLWLSLTRSDPLARNPCSALPQNEDTGLIEWYLESPRWRLKTRLEKMHAPGSQLTIHLRLLLHILS